MKRRIIKRTYSDHYGQETVVFVTQHTTMFGWKSDAEYGPYGCSWAVSFHTLTEAKDYIRKETKYDTIVKEETV